MLWTTGGETIFRLRLCQITDDLFYCQCRLGVIRLLLVNLEVLALDLLTNPLITSLLGNSFCSMLGSKLRGKLP